MLQILFIIVWRISIQGFTCKKKNFFYSRSKSCKIHFLFLILLSAVNFERSGFAETLGDKDKPSPNPHLVGWFNTFLPGGGSLLLGEPGKALQEAAVESLTFGIGYGLSSRSPMTIDGVPENYPAVQTGFGGARKACQVYDPVTRHCKKYVATTGVRDGRINLTPVDLSRPLGAAFLQEIGLKYHMMNVFQSYRESLKRRGGDFGQGLDDQSSGQLLMEPFRAENVFDPWVYVPLALLTGYVIYDYTSQMRTGLSPTQPLNTSSNSFVFFNQLFLYPFGSGAPEEMFYRGFVQNEAYSLVRSPYFSILASTAAFAFSHSSDGQLTAGINGLYLGTLAHLNKGKLGKGIALHFWAVVILGVEFFLLVKDSQAVRSSTPVGVSTVFSF